MVFGHAFLCAAAGFSLNLYPSPSITWAFFTFALLFGHGIIGILISCSERPSTYYNIFDMSLEIIELLPLPFINTELYLKYGSTKYAAYIHSVTAIIPVLLNFILKERISDDIKDLLLLGNIISLLYLSIQNEKILFGTLAGIATLNRFNNCKSGRTAESLSFGLAGFCLLAAYIIKTSEFTKYL